MLVAGCSVFGYRGGTPQPHFDVVDTVGPVAIRHYGPRLTADTQVTNASAADARDTGFKRLAGYIFGDNDADERIEMTAPVGQAPATTDGWRIRFFLPPTLHMAEAPKPDDERISLHQVPGADYAVLRFSGDRSQTAVERHIDILRQHLRRSAWQPDGAPVAWFYDPPWTVPFLRRNEVAIEVTREVGGGP
ncbi:heme-binding protein [Salinisphaera sp. Q1T1-3]|nr:heme-binding protein [Salinisphaera sp. Q1T1-3]